MKMFKKSFLWIILLLSIVIRFSYLSDYPNGLGQDEAQQGYSAYSILKTGKDEWGDFLPLNPKGFGDYKAPLYTYILVPSVALFGLNEFAVRFPSAVIGMLAVLVIYYLVKEIWEKEEVALIAALLLAIAPWHIQYSRSGWEGNMNATLFLSGLLFFLKGLKRPVYFYLSAILFGLNLYSYHSARIFTLLMLPVLTAIFYKDLFKLRKNLVGPAIVGVLLLLPVLFSFSQVSKRASDVSVFNPTDKFSHMRTLQREENWPLQSGKLFTNKATFVLSNFVDNYLSYFSSPFLFTGGRSENSYLNLPGFPLFYLWQLPLIALGVFMLIIKRTKISVLIFAWVLLSVVPAAVGKDQSSAFRGVPLFPVLTIISAFGAYILLNLKHPFSKGFYVFGTVVLFLSLSIFANFYFVHLPNRKLGDMQYGFKDVIAEAEASGKTEVVMSRKYSNPQIFVAFYNKVNPEDFQKFAKMEYIEYDKKGLSYVDQLGEYHLGKYTFRDISWAQDRKLDNVLLIGDETSFPAKVKPVLTIEHPLEKVIFKVVDPALPENRELNI